MNMNERLRTLTVGEIVAADFRAGKDSAIGRLVGHAMKVSGGKADAKTIQAKLREVAIELGMRTDRLPG